MRYFIVVFVFLLVTSCKTQVRYAEEGIYRHYFKKTGEITDELVLNSDSTFFLYTGGTSCPGKWRYESPNRIIINCTSNYTLAETLAQGFMRLRTREIEILSKNRLKLPITANVKKHHILKKEE